ncbi:MAG TPA: serine/threonine-protein kinase [Phycisphaerae bacterium]|mgnify:CR=1 FL=1|nr:serine/threonine protein kinase [Phycisphaerales bacterium]HRX85165.1 serine/threonine-protein kinase [Phycisphaerae bacterium]
MSAADYRRVKEIFAEAAELPAEDRRAYLERACGGNAALRREVESLLAHDNERLDAFSDNRLGDVRAALHEAVTPGTATSPGAGAPTNADVPVSVGRYRVLRAIGHGGMGVVYEAQQENPNRTVAVKVIRPGLGSPRTAQRFEQEAQVLGRLHHPGIAHIYEAGIAGVVLASGVMVEQPFFAMELVRGRPLHEHVARTSLGIPQRLELLARVCDAVQHAHDHGVIHRDLKPGNILVDDAGQPKILDFGVARLTDGDLQATTLHTDVGQIIGTLPYMSPEQVAAGARAPDVRCDVYALGVVLYEALSGQLPLDLRTRSMADAVRVIQTAEPSRLSTVNTLFRGDIETIVAKALEKDPQRRYASAGELAADLRRYLASEPIAARPPSSLYQFRKFARRNKPAVIGAIAVFAVLIAGAVATSIGMIRARQAEALARTRLAEARSAWRESQAVNDFLSEVLSNADPAKTGGRDLPLSEMLERAAARIDDFSDGTPAVTSAIQQTIGRTYQQIGQYRKATEHFRAALALRTQSFGEREERTLRSRYDLADNLFVSGDIDEVAAMLDAEIPALRTEQPEHTELLGRQLYNLGRLRMRQARYADAIAALEESADLLRSRGGPHPPGLGLTLNELGKAYSRGERYADAERILREAIDLQSAEYGPRSPHVAGVMNMLAVTLRRQRRLDEAEKLYREALDIQRRTHGLEHPLTLSTMINLGMLLAQRGSDAEAIALIREALPALRKVHGDDSFDVGTATGMLADALRREGDLAEAEAAARESVKTLQAAIGAHPFTVRALSTLGQTQWDEKHYAEAAASFAAAAEMSAQTLGADHFATTDARMSQAAVLRDAGRQAEADAVFTAVEKQLLALDRRFRDAGDTRQMRSNAGSLAVLYRYWDKPDEVERWTAVKEAATDAAPAVATTADSAD